MSTGWVLLALLGPPLATALAGFALRAVTPPPAVIIALNTLVPGAGLAAAGRPILEVVLCVMFAQASLFITGGTENIGFLVPIMLVGGVWGSLHTPYSVLRLAAEGTPRRVRSEPPSGPSRRPLAPVENAPQESEPEFADAVYAVTVRCTECGADVEVPVLARMARCSFCGSDHMVVGHDETLFVTIPEKVDGVSGVREAVLDHYRYQHYLKLYKSSVAPLERSATEVTSSGALVRRPEAAATVAAAEAVVARKADMYRATLASSLDIRRVDHFLVPYRHGVGTLYQSAFGRDRRDQEKVLRFAVGLVEASTIATDGIELPPMGRLSYLRALVPAAQCSGDLRTLPLDGDRERLQRAYGDLDRKQLVRDIDVIRVGGAFVEEVTAVVWRPWWIAEVTAPGIREALLVDGAAGSVAGTAPYLNPETLGDLPESARSVGSGLRFVPMECPTCGHEYPFDTDAVLHFCLNCHRVCAVEGDRKRQVEYLHQPVTDASGVDLVPFWYFPLRVRTGDGRLLSDLMHFKDGIDGAFDQIGDDAQMLQHGVCVPAFRCINQRLMADAFERMLLHTLRRPPAMTGGRLPLEQTLRPWSVSLDEPEARRLLPLYLANAFSRRDLARVKVQQVAGWLFDARQDAAGRLAYLPVPRQVTEPFRTYVGRYRSRAVRHARAETPPQG